MKIWDEKIYKDGPLGDIEDYCVDILKHNGHLMEDKVRFAYDIFTCAIYPRISERDAYKIIIDTCLRYERYIDKGESAPYLLAHIFKVEGLLPTEAVIEYVSKDENLDPFHPKRRQNTMFMNFAYSVGTNLDSVAKNIDDSRLAARCASLSNDLRSYLVGKVIDP